MIGTLAQDRRECTGIKKMLTNNVYDAIHLNQATEHLQLAPEQRNPVINIIKIIEILTYCENKQFTTTRRNIRGVPLLYIKTIQQNTKKNKYIPIQIGAQHVK